MAITRAQQAKQMLQNGGMLVQPGFGGTRQGYRGEAAAASDAAAGRDAGRSDTGSASGRGDGPDSSGPTRNPMAQFTPEAEKIAREMLDAKMGAGDRFVPDFFPTIKGLANRFQVSKPTPFDIQKKGFIQALRPQAVDMIGGGGDGAVPYWAQLGFSSEAEYLASLAAQGKSTTEQEPEVEEPFQLSRRFRAEGGIMNSDVVGGEFDFESARQMYGLGKLVKKVTRSVKKIAKSPVGKAAILAATYKLGGGKFFGGEGFKFSNLPGLGFLKPASTASVGSVANFAGDRLAFNAARTAAGTSSGGLGIGTLIAGTSVAAGLLTPEEETEAEDLARGEGIDIDAARNAILAARQDDFRARRFRAEGGSMKEPVAKKTMPLLDMGGKEMDLRAEGGFVPIGRMEKADDVPARLSKNEFVFTADAVRNAGDGDVDLGAEKMYNMMKNLEAGGDVSEESQGMDGARKMFQTSQRLEEVI